jgi:DNA-binding beta-propeller fold protein YncE
MNKKAWDSNRRGFLRGAIAGVAAAVFTSKTRANTLGSGAHRYEVKANWGALPRNKAFGYTHGVVVDRQGRIIIHNRSKDSVCIFDEKGKFVKSWGPRFEKGAHGLQLVKEGGDEFLFLSDPDGHEVVKTTLDGEELLSIKMPKEAGVYPDESKFRPTNTAVAPNGDIYVADGYGLSYIHQYSSNGTYKRTWGGKGSEAGKMNCPHGIWIDTRGPKAMVTAADRANARLQNFTLDGKHIGFVTAELRHPCHFDELNGEFLIPDLHGRVTLFDRENKLITHLGDNPGVWKQKGYPNLPQEQRKPGLFISPHGACFDADGNIYVVEWVSDGRVTKLTRV